MNDDPAVLEARRHWENKEYREALTTLVGRINELNKLLEQQALRERQSDLGASSLQSNASEEAALSNIGTTKSSKSKIPATKPTTRTGLPIQRIGPIIIGLILALLISAIIYSLLNPYDGQANVLRIHYSVSCEGDMPLLGEEYCNSWAERVVSRHREAAEKCSDLWGDRMYRCLSDHDVPLPLN